MYRVQIKLALERTQQSEILNDVKRLPEHRECTVNDSTVAVVRQVRGFTTASEHR